jgi:hypothetical protein
MLKNSIVRKPDKAIRPIICCSSRERSGGFNVKIEITATQMITSVTCPSVGSNSQTHHRNQWHVPEKTMTNVVRTAIVCTGNRRSNTHSAAKPGENRSMQALQVAATSETAVLSDPVESQSFVDAQKTIGVETKTKKIMNRKNLLPTTAPALSV